MVRVWQQGLGKVCSMSALPAGHKVMIRKHIADFEHECI